MLHLGLTPSTFPRCVKTSVLEGEGFPKLTPLVCIWKSINCGGCHEDLISSFVIVYFTRLKKSAHLMAITKQSGPLNGAFRSFYSISTCSVTKCYQARKKTKFRCNRYVQLFLCNWQDYLDQRKPAKIEKKKTEIWRFFNIWNLVNIWLGPIWAGGADIDLI